MVSPLWMNKKIINKNNGFSLIELSIVLIIMGLIIAGALAGNDLLNTAKLRAVVSETSEYVTAIHNFKIQYEGLPGDLKTASSFWTTAQNGGTAVQNGDGNSRIGTGASSDKAEPYYAWNHLSLSKYLPGTFTGSSAANATIGVNIPGSKYIASLGYGINYFTVPTYTDALSRQTVGNIITIGKGTTDAYPSGAIFTPSDALYLDEKMDEGTPDSGKIFSFAGNDSSNCTTGSGQSYTYNTTNTSSACMLWLLTDM